jgi:hypothetical protein
LACVDPLILRDVDLFADAGNVGRDADLFCFDIPVIRRHHVTTGEVAISAGD